MQSDGHLFYILALTGEERLVAMLSDALGRMGHSAFTKPLTRAADGMLDEDALAALKASKGVIFFFSRAAAEDVHFKRHLVVANQLGKAMVGVRLEQVDDRPLIPEALGASWTDWYGPDATARISADYLAPPAPGRDPEPPRRPEPEPPPPRQQHPPTTPGAISSVFPFLAVVGIVAIVGALALASGWLGAAGKATNNQAVPEIINTTGIPVGNSAAYGTTTTNMAAFTFEGDLFASEGNSLAAGSRIDNAIEPMSGGGAGYGTAPGNPGGAEAALASMPRFGQYAAAQASPRAPLRLAPSSDWWSMRTRIRDGYAAGANFGGSDTIVMWGCGGGCLAGVLISGATGAIHGLPLGGEANPYLGMFFRRGSNLLIARWEIDDQCRIQAFAWTQSRFAPQTPQRAVPGTCPSDDPPF